MPLTIVSSIDNDESLRERALMLPMPAICKNRQSSLQSQCPIFAILPPEIRRLVWIECVGRLSIPLSFSHHYRWDILRTHWKPAGSDWDLAGSNALCYSMRDRWVRTKLELGLLPILLTCQRVYENHPYLNKHKYCTISDILLKILRSHRYPILLQRVPSSRHMLSTVSS